MNDGGCDPNLEFEDLAGLIRKCRTDFGIRIEIDTGPIKRTATGLSHWHCAIGKIHYEDVDVDAEPGILVYLKSSLTGDEPPDLQQYAPMTQPFRTRPQPISSSTKPSSRVTARSDFTWPFQVFSKVEADAHATLEQTNEAIFENLHDRWFPAPPELEANFDKIAEAYNQLQSTLRSDHNLRAFTYDLYPELARPTDDELKINPYDRGCAELHMVNQMLLLMEKAWIAVKLEGFPEHPMNRGWMNEFRRCADAEPSAGCGPPFEVRSAGSS